MQQRQIIRLRGILDAAFPAGTRFGTFGFSSGCGTAFHRPPLPHYRPALALRVVCCLLLGADTGSFFYFAERPVICESLNMPIVGSARREVSPFRPNASRAAALNN